MPSCFRWKPRRSNSKQLEEDSEWRTKSLRLREGEFLHGELQVEIQEARDLPDTDNFLCNIKKCMGQEKDVTDPYVAVFLDSTRIITTSVIYNNLCPQWNEFFRVSVCHHAKKLLFRIKDQDELGTDNVGEVCVVLRDLLAKPGMKIHGWQDIIDTRGQHQGQLFLKVLYIPCQQQRGQDAWECPDCYFPLRPGNAVTLYSCARNSDSTFAFADNDDDRTAIAVYSPPSLWIDLYKSIVAAQRFVYITGWSVNTKIKMLRGDDWTLLRSTEELALASLTLGELLKRKAEEGVRVLLMIWGETTSIMGTHDTETENYFKGTSVFVARVARQTKTREYKDLDAHFTANLGYSHHQKAVIVDGKPEVTTVDQESAAAKVQQQQARGRSIVAYVGGIDVTDGRYDTPEHPLFRTLATVHLGDFYQPCEPSVKSAVGPRLPWQDIHARVEGPAARDIMINFVERWGKERPLHSRLLIQDVVPPEYDFSPLPPPSCKPSTEEERTNPEAEAARWNVQVFRSITSDSARFQLENETSFTTKKGRSVDNSIARAYTAAIRGASRFIYIENQYFIGSAYGWMDDQNVHCYNVIPMEVTQKICESIEAGRRFTVYIVIPMHPEGIPTDNAIQEMLFWQRRTMQMMYTRIAQAIHASPSASSAGAHPTDYLMFFCLGKKERLKKDEEVARPAGAAANGQDNNRRPGERRTRMKFWSRAARLRRTRRFMIYVHSKLMIVDDAYLIVGSANVNQRSLDGDRDSELAVGACQQGLDDAAPARGDVFKFRMALFREHTGRTDPSFADPSTQECVRMMQNLSLQNWRDYEDRDGDDDPAGHLLAYPVGVAVRVMEDIPVVKLEARTRNRCFPDTRAKILGRPAKSIPNKLTT